MSGKSIYIRMLPAACLFFLIMAFILDRDLARYPFVKTAGAAAEEQSILDAISLYNSIMTDIHVSGGAAKLLNELPATKSMRHLLFRDIGYLQDSGRILVYDLAGMKPVSIKLLSPFAAEAVVFEEWNYLYQRSDDRRPLSDIKGLGRGFRYRLVRQDNRWIVSAWDPVDTEEREDHDHGY